MNSNKITYVTFYYNKLIFECNIMEKDHQKLCAVN